MYLLPLGFPESRGTKEAFFRSSLKFIFKSPLLLLFYNHNLIFYFHSHFLLLKLLSLFIKYSAAIPAVRNLLLSGHTALLINRTTIFDYIVFIRYETRIELIKIPIIKVYLLKFLLVWATIFSQYILLDI